jgi:hypothetical protein
VQTTSVRRKAADGSNNNDTTESVKIVREIPPESPLNAVLRLFYITQGSRARQWVATAVSD